MFRNNFKEILKTEILVAILKKVPLQFALQRNDVRPLAFPSLPHIWSRSFGAGLGTITITNRNYY